MSTETMLVATGALAGFAALCTWAGWAIAAYRDGLAADAAEAEREQAALWRAVSTDTTEMPPVRPPWTGRLMVRARDGWRDLGEHLRAWAADIGTDHSDPWADAGPLPPADEPTAVLPVVRTRGQLAPARRSWPLRAPVRHIPQHYRTDTGMPTPTLLARRLSAGWQVRAHSAAWWPQMGGLA